MTLLNAVRSLALGIAGMSIAASLLAAELPVSLRDLRPGADVDVIVEYRDGARDSVAGRLDKLGAASEHESQPSRLRQAKLKARHLRVLEQDPDIVAIHPNQQVSATDYNGKLDYGWMTATGITTKSGTLSHDGTGIAIAIIDSGITQTPDLRGAGGANRIVYQQSFVPGENWIYDDYGHGTHVAGIAGGRGINSNQAESTYKVRGVAPAVKFVNLRVLNGQGVGTDAAVIAAVDRAIQLKSTYNIRVINLSLGRPVTTSFVNDPLCQAVKRAWDAGIVVVAAAGNEGRNNSAGTSGYGLISAPGNSPYVITVGAMNTRGTMGATDDVLTSFSSKGPTLIDQVAKPDLVAPGNAIVSVRGYDVGIEVQNPRNLVPTSAYTPWTYEQDYFQISGTSMAAPYVSGAAAVMIHKNPLLTPDQVKARLMKTASKNFPGAGTAVDPVTGQAFVLDYNIFTVGAGYLNIPAALANTDLAIGSAASPKVVFDSTNKTVTLLAGSNLVWGTNLVWGSNLVWGTNLVWGSSVSANNLVWGSGVVWGSGSTAGTNLVWGSNLVWGTNLVWGSGANASVDGLSLALNGDQ